MTSPSNPYAELIEARDILAMFIAEEDESGLWAKNIRAGLADRHPATVRLIEHISALSQLTRDVEELFGLLDEMDTLGRSGFSEHGTGELQLRVANALDKHRATLTRLAGEEQ